MRWRNLWTLVALALLSCATQPPYRPPALPVESSWSNAGIQPASTIENILTRPDESWWLRLHDPAIDALAEAALADNPSLAQAAAAVDEARATLRLDSSARLPEVSLLAAAARARAANPALFAAPLTVVENSAIAGPSFSWELDLWGRVRQTAQAASSRLTARGADAEEARISLVAQIANAVLSLRACEYSLSVRNRDIAARETELILMRRRLSVGNVAPVQEATAGTNLANARTDQISQQEQCTRTVDILVALTGQDSASVQALIAPSKGFDPDVSDLSGVARPALTEVDPAALMPAPPPLSLALPAAVLLHHPRVISAERELAARWSEIAVARAERLPTLDLAAALDGNWLRALGHAASFLTWSAGGNLSTPLFDGGAGAAQVHGAQARYAQALADLRETLRGAAQDVEDALAAQRSAEERAQTSRQAVQSGRLSMLATEARWRAGAISVFELEEARREFNGAQEREIAAARDRAQAWVELIRATGNSVAVDVSVATTPDASARGVSG